MELYFPQSQSVHTLSVTTSTPSTSTSISDQPVTSLPPPTSTAAPAPAITTSTKFDSDKKWNKIMETLKKSRVPPEILFELSCSKFKRLTGTNFLFVGVNFVVQS